MFVRRLWALAVAAILILAPATHRAAAQTMTGPGLRTEMTPAEREAHNGVFDRIKRGLGLAAGKAGVIVGELRATTPVHTPPEHGYTTDPFPEARPEAHPEAPPEAPGLTGSAARRSPGG